MSEIIDVLTPFYKVHYNFGMIAAFILLFAAYLGSRKNVKGLLITLGVFIAYNLVMFNFTRNDPDWYTKKETEVKAFDPVKKLWENKPADDDVKKRK